MLVEYKRDLSHNYMLIGNEGELRTDTYDMRTILTNRIYGLLPIDAEDVNGEIVFRYDISECVPFVSFCEGGRVSAAILRRLFLSILHTLEEFDDYLLDNSHLLLDPEYVFVQWESVSVYMAYVPYLEKDIQRSLLALTEAILMQISHEQQDSIVLACRILHELQGKNMQLASLRRLLEEGEDAEGMMPGAKGGPVMDGSGNTGAASGPMPSFAAGPGPMPSFAAGPGNMPSFAAGAGQGSGSAAAGYGGFGQGYESSSNAAGWPGQGHGTSSNAVGGPGQGYGPSSNAAGGFGQAYGSSSNAAGGFGQGYGAASNTGSGSGQGFGFGSNTGGAGQSFGFGSNTGGSGQGYGSAPYGAGGEKTPFGGGYGYGKQDTGKKKGWGREKRKKEKKKKEKADGKKTGSLGWGGIKNEGKAPKAEKNAALKKHLPERATVKLALLSAIPAALLFAALHVQEVFVLSTAEAAGISILTAALILVILELAARIKDLKSKKKPAREGSGMPGQEQPQAADSWDAYAGNVSFQANLPKPSPGGGFQAGTVGGTAGGNGGGAAGWSAGGTGGETAGGNGGTFVPLYQQASVNAPSQSRSADVAASSSQRGSADVAASSSQRGAADFASAPSQRGPADGTSAKVSYAGWEDASDGRNGIPGAEGAAAALLPEDPGSPLTPIPLQGREILIGKQKSLVDMVIQDDTVSRIHARIFRKNGAYFISDMGSKNGTFVDGQAVVGREEVMLTEGARVRFSGCSYTYHALPALA